MTYFFVPGIPQTKGSTKAFPITRRNGKRGVVVTNANVKNKAWEQTVQAIATRHAPKKPWAGPICVSLTFFLQKPARPKASYPITKPDLDKLARSINDALTGLFYWDDCQIVELPLRKFYGQPGVSISVWEVKNDAKGT